MNLLVGDLCVAATYDPLANLTTTSAIGLLVQADDELPWGPGPERGPSQEHTLAGATPLTGLSDVARNGSGAISTGSRGYTTHWSAVEIFFTMCVVLTMLGCTAICIALGDPAVVRRLRKRDISFRMNRLHKERKNLYEGDDINAGSSLLTLTGDDDGSDGHGDGFGSVNSVHSSPGQDATTSAAEQSMSPLEIARHMYDFKSCPRSRMYIECRLRYQFVPALTNVH